MIVAIATVQVPFIRGGATLLAEGLAAALKTAGSRVETVTMPFRFAPPDAIRRSMDAWAAEELESVNGIRPDRLICLSFPSFYARHPLKVAWLIHQHRHAYELQAEVPAAGAPDAEAWRRLRQDIVARDTAALGACRARFSISRTVADRLHRNNGLEATALYHPPALEPRFFSAPAEPYIFFPSRLEQLKRQDLLIRAMAHVRAPVAALLAGEGGQAGPLRERVRQSGLEGKVRLLGAVSDEELLGYYAHSLAVFFGPRDEDYGYVTLEAMLAAKPVITCRDSGGPLEFVIPGETGMVTEPEPEAVAEAIDTLYADRSRAVRLGEAGRERYRALGLSWENVVQRLLHA